MYNTPSEYHLREARQLAGRVKKLSARYAHHIGEAHRNGATLDDIAAATDLTAGEIADWLRTDRNSRAGDNLIG